MRYVLAIGLETEIYKNPRLEVFLNDRFLGMTELDKSIPAEMQQHKKGDLLDAWDFKPYTNPERNYKVTMPKKWIIYELDDSDFNKDNRLDIVPKNLQTNTMNGFVSKMDKCTIFDVMLLPKDWFSSEGIQKIFSHCDGRNVVIDFEDIRGWPKLTMFKNKKGTGLYPVYNASASCNITYDEILELYTIEHSPESSEAELLMPSHVTFKEHYKQAKKYDAMMPSFKSYACHPQKLFENNNDTTLLIINNAVKLQLDQIATKYQHNED